MKTFPRLGGMALLAVVLTTPAIAGPPFLTDDPEPAPPGEYEVYTFAAGGWGQGGESGAVGIDFNYGGAPDLQLTATVPFAVEHPDGGDRLSGLGDIELAAKWRFLHQETAGVDVAFFPRVYLPSGSEMGSDRASLLLPLWVERDFDSVSTFGGGGCAINRGGAAQDYCLAGWAVTHQVTQELKLGAEVFHQTPEEKGGRHSTIVGLGATWDISESLHILGYAGAQLQHRDENGDGLGYASMLFTF